MTKTTDAEREHVKKATDRLIGIRRFKSTIALSADVYVEVSPDGTNVLVTGIERISTKWFTLERCERGVIRGTWIEI